MPSGLDPSSGGHAPARRLVADGNAFEPTSSVLAHLSIRMPTSGRRDREPY
jgi:hypothetical protein